MSLHLLIHLTSFGVNGLSAVPCVYDVMANQVLERLYYYSLSHGSILRVGNLLLVFRLNYEPG